MLIKKLENNDLKNFISFCKENLPNSFVYNKKFLDYWFRDKNYKWLIRCVYKKKKICSINIKIENQAILNKKIYNFYWTSTAFTICKNKKDPNIGLILIDIHKNSDIVGSICPNKYSYSLNESLGRKINNIKLQRYIFLHNKKFLKIIKKDKKIEFKNLSYKRINRYKNTNSSWVSNIPTGYNNLWKNFSSRFNLCINKNDKFIKKRYLNNKFQDYKFLKVNNFQKELVGFAVIRYQQLNDVKFARIIEFISKKNFEYVVWKEILYRNYLNNASISDFFVVGNNQNKNLNLLGFKKMNKTNIFYNIPNLLSPLNYRQWSDDFYLGGLKIKKLSKNFLKKIWFTKGDGDRDYPTRYDIKI